MLFLSIDKLDLPQKIHAQIDAIELRLDLLPCIDLPAIATFLKNSPLPVLLTLRGGRIELIEKLLFLEPDFFDLEYDTEFLKKILDKYPKTKFILSYHNFEKIPEDLTEIYSSMEQHPVFGLKIAVMVHSSNEAIQMLLFAKKRPKLCLICMGDIGSFTRVLNFPFNYTCASEKEKTAPGQLCTDELIDIYRYPSLNRETKIYGLIGDPIEQSIGHIYHNDVFQKRGINAVYLKMVVKEEELKEFISLAKDIGIQGLSVTAPLKEKILPFIQSQEASINTLLFQKEQILGINTDGMSAIEVIEKKTSIKGKKMVILGAGGTAIAIASEAKKKGALIWILNRTEKKAHDLAQKFGYIGGGLLEIPDNYDILINCSSQIIPYTPLKGTLVMDVVYTRTSFLEQASSHGCQIIHGKEMFLSQAFKQTSFWFE